MTDKPYGLSIFENVIDCHFGDDWFAVVGPRGGAPSVGTNISLEIDFPGTSGGTPGFIPVISNGINFGPVIFGSFVRSPTSPQIIRPSDLTNKVMSNAGKQFTCFAIGQVDAFGAAMMFFKMTNFAPTPFTVRVRQEGVSEFSNVGVVCFERGKLKAGLTFVSSFDLPLAPGGAVYADLPNGATDFVIDPSKLTITVL